MTLGLYDFYWFYQQWRWVQQQHEPTLSPIWRSLIFPYFYCYGLFRRVQQTHSMVCGPSSGWDPVVCAVLWVGLLLSSQLPQVPYIWLLKGVALLPIQARINQVNRAIAAKDAANERFSLGNFTAIGLGGGLMLASIAQSLR
jgi:hypothetical protein